MPWYIYALLGPFCWALVNQADKYMVAKYYSESNSDDNHPGSLVLFSSLFGFCAALGIALFVPHLFALPLKSILILILAGFFATAGIILYLYGLQTDEVSSVAPWFLTESVFGYFLGILFLNETLHFGQILWGIVILLGATILSLDFRQKKIRFKKKVTLLMLGACFLVVFSGVLFKYVAIEDNFWISQFWQYIGLGLAGAIIFLASSVYRRDFLSKLKTSGTLLMSLNIGNELVTTIGNLMINFATLLAPVALVYTFTSFQAAYVFGLSILFTLLGSKTNSEDMSWRNVVPKLVAIAIMIFGSVMIAL